jgi:hypothetical protein
MMPSEVRKLRQIEEESANLKRLVAGLSLDKAMLRDVLSKNVWSAPIWQAWEVVASTVCINVSGLFVGHVDPWA